MIEEKRNQKQAGTMDLGLRIKSSDSSFKNEMNTYKVMLRSYKNWNKCFGVGCNKTASTSLDYIMKSMYGLRSAQSNIEATSTFQVIKGNYQPLIEFMQQNDFGQDLPFSQGETYVAADALFPKSKFILTIRDSISWVKSFTNQYLLRFCAILRNSELKSMQNYLFRGYSHYWISHYWSEQIQILKDSISNKEYLLEDDKSLINHIASNQEFIESCIYNYQSRNKAILNYFSKRENDFLCIDLSKEKDISRLSDFLNFPNILHAPIPKLNTSDKKDKVESNEHYLDYSKFNLYDH